MKVLVASRRRLLTCVQVNGYRLGQAPLNAASARVAWLICGIWLMLTIAVEFLGHYLFAHSSAEFLAVYNVARGQIWILVLMTMPAVVYGGHLGRAEMSSACARPK